MPIGVFDSGMGGLTVLRALRDLLPDESYLYLGDTARLPYGTKSPRTVARYALQSSDLLVSRGVKALVIACNTASGIALKALREQYRDIPVIGVVEPGARAAAAVSKSGGVLVLATESTIAGGAYQRALLRLNPRIRVSGRSCPLWVTLAEQGRVSDRLLEAALDEYLPGSDCPGTILLGCTHFPVFSDGIQQVLGPEYHIVDSARTTAEAVRVQLGGLDLLGGGQSGMTFMATDGADRFQKVGGYFLGESVSSVELVDL